MKYKDILGLYEYFQPVYDITSEQGNYWKQFIPTKIFLETLKTFLNSLESKESQNRKSIWLQGAYGTGKSHATGVIKHLLWDDLEEIEDFIEKINDVQLREKLRRFRKENRVFPITLKGISGISDPKSLSLTIEEAVKESLKRENIEICTKSEFEKYIEKISNDDSFNWDKIIEKDIELKSLVKNSEGLLKELKTGNIDILRILEKRLDFRIPHPKIEDWLIEVLKELQKKGITFITIYWDEFTPLMELSISSSILSILQNIAEKSFNENIFLFIISHRTPEQVEISKVDYEKVLGRFHFVEYSMENITTFHIMSNAIKKKDENKWKEMRDEIYSKNPAFKRITQKLIGEDSSLRNILMDLFPIHPYTAGIATAISQYIGSSERSIFNFLYDGEKGFQKFISEYPKEHGSKDYFLTSDFLWDFFLDDFKRRSSEKVGPIISKYSLHIDSLERKGPQYTAIFKGILLLNLLSSYIGIFPSEARLYAPSEENIRDMFLGTSYEYYLDEVLAELDKSGYVPKAPDGLFLISLTSLPSQEISTEKESLKREYLDVTKLLDKDQKDKLVKDLTENVLREFEVQIYWSGLKDLELKRRLINDFRKPYSLHIALFLSRDKTEISNIRDTIKRLMEEESNVKNVIFIISDAYLGEENYERIIEYLARERVANKHAYKEEAEINRNYATTLIEEWIKKIGNDFFEVYFQDENDKSTFKVGIANLGDQLNRNLSPKIFRFGLENIEELTKNRNVWKTSHSEKVAKIFLFSDTRDTLEEETRNASYRSLRGILMNKKGEYIVDRNLKFYTNIDMDHPTAKIYKEVEYEIEKKRGQTFNLGDTLAFLREPPYGLYHNMVNYAALSFALRPFIGKLYESGTGRKITEELLKDKIVDLFKYWEDGKNREKLEVRLGTPAEEELIKLLMAMFDIKEEENLNKIRWRIREWVKNTRFPLWALKTLIGGSKELDPSIDVLRLLIKNVDRELNEERIKKSVEILKQAQGSLKPLLNREKLKEGFVNWLKSLEEVKVEDDEVEEVIEYLYKNMQEEVSLWEEDKVIIKLKDWVRLKEKSITEREFISLLERIFNVESSKTQEELRKKIKERINQLGYPLWLLRYVLRAEIGKALDNINRFIKTEFKLAEDNLKEMLENLRPYETLLSTNLSSDVLKQGLYLWLREKNISNIDVDVFTSYLKVNFPKEPYQWEEKDLEDSLKKCEFLKKLSEIFKVDFSLSLKDLKEGIKRKIQDSPYPFWSFELVEDEEVRRIVEEIRKFLTSTYDLNLNTIEVEQLLDLIHKKENVLKDVFVDYKAKELFLNWLKNTLNFDEDLLEFTDEIRRKMPGEDYYWNKDRVESWINKNLANLIPEKKKERIKEKIRTTQRDLREVLIEIVDKYPQICNILEDLLK